MKLKEKQKKFADYFIKTGNAYRSAVKAGYSENYAKGNVVKLLDNVSVKEYIEERNKLLESERIADMKEVKEFWTNTMRSDEAERKDRLKASEMIAKTNAAFVDKVEHSGEQELNINFNIPRSKQ